MMGKIEIRMEQVRASAGRCLWKKGNSMGKVLVVVLLILFALITVSPAAAGSCKDFGHAWADFGRSGEAGSVVSSLASNGNPGPFPVDGGPGVLARIVHFEMEFVYPCD
jgi:hypothetical protein